MRTGFKNTNCLYEYDVEEIFTPTTWSYTQKLDISELRYMVLILWSDNEVMQARCIRRIIELICRSIRQGFCDEMIEVINEEQLRKMLRQRTKFSRKEVQMIRDVLTHIIDAIPPFEQEIEENIILEQTQEYEVEPSSNSSSNSDSERNQIIEQDQEEEEEEAQMQLEQEVYLLQKAISEGKEHLYNKKWRQEIANNIKQRSQLSSRSFRRSRRNKSSCSNSSSGSYGSGISANSSKSGDKCTKPVNAIHANE
ncbi:MAG: hypothetical protein EZS28_021411 [Streblomastix strix]|uniref:Uncharacterized protein n=1 Tax=Streblomastix strix TaxID=222440 RepID=A0A5J4VLG6_9EUKA|nr:MAG: hypothetical protein EZS28_021411 [Streblomastix strix]